MRANIKKLLYKVNSYALPADVTFRTGYIFHTEAVQDSAMFSTLLSFCKEYEAITGKQPICTVMSGVNPRIADEMKRLKCSEQELADRYHTLSQSAVLGYHGHFHLNTAHYQRVETELRSNNFVRVKLEEQVNNDLDWFARHGLNHNGLYAGGWWFMNHHLQALLMEKGFKYDFSFSWSPHFRNQFSHQLMVMNNIRTGQPFEITIPSKGRLREIQNLTGAHHTPFFEDFTRNLLQILDPEQKEVTGLHNDHDYSLNAPHTLMVYRRLAALPNVSFFDARDLLNDSLKLTYFPVTVPQSMFHGPEYHPEPVGANR